MMLPSLTTKRLKRFLTICLIGLMAFMTLQSSWINSSDIAKAASIHILELKRKSTQMQIRRIHQIKQQIIAKEQFVTSNIIANQKRLSYTQSSMNAQVTLYQHNKMSLSQLEQTLSVTLSEQQALARQVAKRLRSLYMGERLGFLHMLLDASNLSTMLDRFYYKKRIFAQDKKLYAAFLSKTQVLEDKKAQLAVQKNSLTHTIQRIQSYKEQLQESMDIDKIMVHRLKTSQQAYDEAENQLQQESNNIERQIMAATIHGGPVTGSTGQFMRPVSAGITSGFGYRFHPIFHTTKFHSGLDFGAHYGTPVRAADGGLVIHSGWQGGYGRTVIISHGNHNGQNIATLYGHMSATAINSGQAVSKGQVIGYVGSTGYSTGPHLHFEVRLNGRPVNPLGYLR